MKNMIIKDVFKQEIQCSMGCTEPSALAYAIAYSKEVINESVKEITVKLSSNMLKNALCVNIPNTNLSGIELIVLLGMVSCNSKDKLTILKNVSSRDLEEVDNLKNNISLKVELIENVDSLYIDVQMISKNHVVNTIIEGNHEKIKACSLDGNKKISSETNTGFKYSLNDVTYEDIFSYINNTDYDKELLDEVIKYNVEIADYGLDNKIGLSIGNNISQMDMFKEDYSNIVGKTVAGIDARMSGIPKKVYINSGSGNQGITATIPVIEMAKKLKVSKDKAYRALMLSHLTAIYIRSKQNKLSSSCGAVCASAGVAAGLTYLLDGSYEEIKGSITNLLCSNFGVFCDGAKVTCSLKVASTVSAAITSALLAKNGVFIQGNYGVISSSLEETLKNLSEIEKEFTKNMDKTIMNIAMKNKILSNKGASYVKR